jgi:phytoene synthase
VTGAPADADLQAVTASARAGEPDRYLAALLSPRDARDGLLALAAFAAEVGRVPLLVTREPAMGEIRLQWWRDGLLAPSGTLTGHPVADALRAAIQRHDLPLQLLNDAIDARAVDLRPEPPADDTAFDDYLWKSEGTLFALAARMLGAHPSTDRRAAHAGHAYGLARLLLALPRTLSRGRVPIPLTRLQAAGVSAEDLLCETPPKATLALLTGLRAEARKNLADARQHVAKLPRRVRTAYLPLALVEPYVRSLERPGIDPLREGVEVAPLTRVVRIAAAHWLRRL